MKINPLENNKIEFDINVEGTNAIDNIATRLILHNKNYDLCFNGKIKNNLCEFNIPILDKIVVENKITAKVEIIYENKYFNPWSGIIEIDKPLVFKVNESKKENKAFFDIKPKNVTSNIELKKTNENKFFPKIGKIINLENKKTGKIRRVVIDSIGKRIDDKHLVKIKNSNGLIEEIKLNLDKI